MIITNCPRCGAMNATTTCTKCGWSQFTKSTVSTVQIEWVFEDQLPDGIPDAVYSAMYACSEVDFVRVFPSVTVDGRKRFLIELPEVQQ